MKWFFRILIGVIALAGIGLMGYPLLSNYLYERSQAELIEYYENLAEEMPLEERSPQWDRCNEYNAGLLTGETFLNDPFDWAPSEPDTSVYDSLLNLRGDGSMGSLILPNIAGTLIIYHGTGEESLQKGVGHLQGTSLPVGGAGTHCVLSAHTGLSGKRLFTNLDQMEEGDVFFLNVLGEKLAYQVDQIKVVLPYEIEDIKIDPDEDYVTLVTCTPYGINSHRLLVRGTRIPYEEAEEIETEQENGISTWILMYLKSILAGVAIAAALGLIIWLLYRIRKRR